MTRNVSVKYLVMAGDGLQTGLSPHEGDRCLQVKDCGDRSIESLCVLERAGGVEDYESKSKSRHRSQVASSRTPRIYEHYYSIGTALSRNMLMSASNLENRKANLSTHLPPNLSSTFATLQTP